MAARSDAPLECLKLEKPVASLIILLCLCAFMFAAGYEWRKIGEHRGTTAPDGATVVARDAVWRGMLSKI